MLAFGREPTLIIQSVVAALEVVQTTIVSMPIWAHALVGAAIVGLGAIVNRSQVTPVPTRAASVAASQ